jgi:signal transduction histidine kinase
VEPSTSAPRYHLLLVDDEEVDRMAVRRALTKAGVDADLREAADVESALAAMGSARPDLVLLDYMLPGGDGLDVLRRARESGVKVPFIVLTGRGDEEIAVNLMKAGVADYIPKSALAPLRLAMSVHGSIARHRLQEECDALLVRERQALRDLEAANRARDEFLAMVSHDLRTPLSAILNWAHLLQDERLDEPTRRRGLAAIERSAENQRELIERLLDLSRISEGKLRVDLQPIDPAALARAAVEIVRPAAHAKGIEIREDLEEAAGTIRGDGERLQQVFWNLLSNAIKFSARGGRVRLILRRRPEALEIVVEDEGRGISTAALGRLFHRFEQGDLRPEEREGGLGLGLAITRHIVEAHGGTVRAESPGPGLGATFVVELPVGG